MHLPFDVGHYNARILCMCHVLCCVVLSWEALVLDCLLSCVELELPTSAMICSDTKGLYAQGVWKSRVPDKLMVGLEASPVTSVTWQPDVEWAVCAVHYWLNFSSGYKFVP